MGEWLVLVHTLPPLIEVFNDLVRQLLPGVSVKHILDEPLLESVRQRGQLGEEDARRLETHLRIAEKIGARACLVTCSTVSPLIDELRPLFTLPLIKVDEAMISRAVQDGRRIRVLATNSTTLAPTRLMLDREAERVGKETQVEVNLIEDALSLLLSGDGEAHDRLVRQAILNVDAHTDIIVLAQASMARVLNILPEGERPAPVYSSPHLALESLKPVFQSKIE